MSDLASPTIRSAAPPVVAACRNVSVVYGRGEGAVVALDSVDVSFHAGETVALWGPSGSGKTTVLHALGGLVEPTSGVVEWDGAPLSSLDASARGRARARGIAYVFQGSNLLPSLTAFENVAFASYVSRTSDDGARGALELLALVGLEQRADSMPSELSGGEAQRVAIARALAEHPRFLLCDEPTGHLDSDTSQRVLDLIGALQRRFDFTLVVATHDANIAAGLGRLVELRDGAIVEDAP